MDFMVFKKEFNSTTEAVSATLSEALAALSARQWCDPNNNFCIRLCLEEALVNAVVHGNNNCPDCKICLRIVEDGESCKIQIRDEGCGFDPNSVHMPDCNQMGGRGVCLIKEYMDEVNFNGTDNTFEMTFGRDTFSGACT